MCSSRGTTSPSMHRQTAPRNQWLPRLPGESATVSWTFPTEVGAAHCTSGSPTTAMPPKGGWESPTRRLRQCLGLCRIAYAATMVHLRWSCTAPLPRYPSRYVYVRKQNCRSNIGLGCLDYCAQASFVGHCACYRMIAGEQYRFALMRSLLYKSGVYVSRPAS